MATSKFSVSEGSGINIGTHAITEDAVTKQLQRVVLADSTGSDIFASDNQYTVTGAATAVVAASLAANTTLMAMRNGASKSIYINRLRVAMSVATVGTSALVSGTLGWQRFTTATPTGGTPRTVAKKKTSYAASTITDVRDSNAALTVTGVSFTDLFSMINVPIMTVGFQTVWAIDLDEHDQIILDPNEGICLRTQSVMPATQTWVYSYLVEFSEK